MRRLISTLLLSTVISGCATTTYDWGGRPVTSFYDIEQKVRLAGFQLVDVKHLNGQLIAVNYTAVDKLLASSQGSLDPSKPLLVATIVDINDLEKSSTFGRLVSSQITSRLQNLGFAVVQVETRKNPTLSKSEGILMLSRDLRDLLTGSQAAQAAVVGTYAGTSQATYVHLELVDGNSILGAYDYAVPGFLGPRTPSANDYVMAGSAGRQRVAP
jgi:flagellar FlgO protein